MIFCSFYTEYIDVSNKYIYEIKRLEGARFATRRQMAVK